MWTPFGNKYSEINTPLLFTGVKKGAKVALCGMKSIDLTIDSIKILGVHFSYNKTLETERNFVCVMKKNSNSS